MTGMDLENAGPKCGSGNLSTDVERMVTLCNHQALDYVRGYSAADMHVTELCGNGRRSKSFAKKTKNIDKK